MKVVIGIDPGGKGAFVKRKGSEIEIYSVEQIRGKEVDFLSMSEAFNKMIEGEDDVVVVIEDVHSIHKSSAKSNFSFGFINGFKFCLAVNNRLKLVKVAPKEWQKEMFKGIPPCEDKKVMSIMAAKRLFPNVNLKRTEKSKVDHDGISDALLISEYAIRKNL